MKTKLVLLALSILGVGTQVFAGNGEQLFKKKVNNHISYPTLKGEDVNAEVFVQFTVSEAGELVIDSISSESEEINAAIVKQLSRIKVDECDAEVIGKTFKYRFVLKVQ